MSDVTAAPDEPSLEVQKVRAMRKCTPKQRTWLKALPDNNWCRWGTGVKLGYSSQTVHRWLRKPHIQLVLALMEQIAEVNDGVTSRLITNEHKRLSISSLKQFFDDTNQLLPPTRWTDDMAAAVQEYSFDSNGLPRIKLFPKHPSLENLAKLKKLTPPDRHELTGKNGTALAAPVINIGFGNGGPGDEPDTGA